jgi:hypothetical protein
LVCETLPISIAIAFLRRRDNCLSVDFVHTIFHLTAKRHAQTTWRSDKRSRRCIDAATRCNHSITVVHPAHHNKRSRFTSKRKKKTTFFFLHLSVNSLVLLSLYVCVVIERRRCIVARRSTGDYICSRNWQGLVWQRLFCEQNNSCWFACGVVDLNCFSSSC